MKRSPLRRKSPLRARTPIRSRKPMLVIFLLAATEDDLTDAVTLADIAHLVDLLWPSARR